MGAVISADLRVQIDAADRRICCYCRMTCAAARGRDGSGV
jgi:hypothetical protein